MRDFIEQLYEEETNPYVEGKHSFFIGKSIRDNPFTEKLDRELWIDGWNDASEEDSEIRELLIKIKEANDLALGGNGNVVFFNRLFD